MAAWAKRAYTLRELASAPLRPRPESGRTLLERMSDHRTRTERAARVERHRQPRLKHLST
jgi:hypothetical protein